MPIVLPNDFVNDTTADAIPVQQNYSVIEQYMNANVITRDGSVAMASPLLLAGTPTQPLHAATKAYVDAESSELNAATQAYIDNHMTRFLTATGTGTSTTDLTTPVVANTLSIPAMPIVGHWFVTMMMRLYYPAVDGVGYVDFYDPAGASILAQDYPCTPSHPSVFQYHCVLAASWPNFPAGEAHTLQVRLLHVAGPGAIATITGPAVNRIDAVWIPAT